MRAQVRCAGGAQEALRLFAAHEEADLCTLEPGGVLHLKSSAWIRPRAGRFWERARLADARCTSRRALALEVTLQFVQVAIRAPPSCTSFGCTILVV